MDLSNRLRLPISELSGIGKTRAAKLNKLGIYTTEDLLYHFPRYYENRGNVRQLGTFSTDTLCSYVLTVASTVASAKVKRGITISKFRAFDDSGSCEVIFFNSPFVKDVFKVGAVYRFYAKASFSKTKRLTLLNPKYEPYVDGVDLPDFTPIYPLTDGINSKLLTSLVKNALNDSVPYIKDFLPENIRLNLGLPSLSFALKNIHFPTNIDDLNNAKRRLAFDELLLFGMGISLSKHHRAKSHSVSFAPCDLKPVLNELPYELTDSQKSAVNDIYRDTVLNSSDGAPSAMTRIIIGDVGCGKTICAVLAAYIAIHSGYQCAVMVPTEILAAQHFEQFSKLLCKLGYNVVLLTGSCTQAQKRSIYASLESGDIDVVIGTHALISDKVAFNKLGLVITDEQHRFGVAQRAKLKDKSKNAHLLVMSATPIPRSLALAMYGDLDITRITDMPKGRQRVDTFVVDENYRDRLNDFILKQVSLGGQCYVVCPSIEANDELENDDFNDDEPRLKNTQEYTEALRRALPNVKIECLNGKMSNAEKEAVMSSFVSAETNVLVSTTVIEVGVNVPNATLMIIENAERFGLSQLHQLRGRVGRGDKKAYCVLVSDAKNEKSTSRLQVMRTTYNGFDIAEKDLVMRGPGDFFSSNNDVDLRQSGGFEFKIASTYLEENLLDLAFSISKQIVSEDPELSLECHSELKKRLDNLIYNDSTIS